MGKTFHHQDLKALRFLATGFTDFTEKPRYFATNEHELTQIFHHEVHEEPRSFFS